jgi:hypothetical protein
MPCDRGTVGENRAAGGLANALPVITTRIELIGPAIITRSSLLLFRIAEISSAGDLTLAPHPPRRSTRVQ